MAKVIKKHRIIKTHNTHMGLVSLLFVILFLIGTILFFKLAIISDLSEADFKLMNIGLLFTLNITLIVIAIIFIVFYIEFKDAFIEKN